MVKKSRLGAEELLPKVIDQLLSVPDAEGLLHKVLALAREALGADEVSLLLIDPARRELVEHEAVGKKLRPKSLRFRIHEEGVVGWVASHKLPQILPDVRKDKRYVKVDGAVRSEAAVPILSGDRVLGVLNLESRQLGFFQKSYLPLLTFLASQIAIALRIAELNEQGRLWQERLSAVHNLTRLGGGVVPFETMLRRVAETMRTLCGGHYAAIFQGDYDREELVLLAQSSAHPLNIATGARQKFRAGILGKAFTLGEVVNVRDVRRDPMYLFKIPGVLSELCVPISVGERPVGILDVQAQAVGEFTADEVMFCEIVARFLAPALQSRVLKPVR